MSTSSACILVGGFILGGIVGMNAGKAMERERHVCRVSMSGPPIILELPSNPTPTPDELWAAICMMESSGNPFAVGDNGLAVGIAQIHPIMVEDVNRILGEPRFILEDRRDPIKSRAIFTTYTNHYTPSWDPFLVGARWNGGPRGETKAAAIAYANRLLTILNGT